MLTASPDHVTTTRDTPVIISVLKNDTGKSPRIAATSSPGYGNLALNSNQTITYTPPPTFLGLDSFSYTIADESGATSVSIVTIHVVNNAPPDAVNDYITVTTGIETLIPVLENDNDPDEGDRFGIIASTAPSFGTIGLSEDQKSFRYKATSGYVGNDSFIYTVQDGHGGTAKAKVVITVESENSPPELKHRRFETYENVPLEIDLKECACDPDGDPVFFHRIGRPGHGSLSVTNGNRGYYVPNQGYVGLDSFEYVVRDSRNATSAGTIEIKVKEKNIKPSPANDNVQTIADTPVTIDVLANDVDLDNDKLAISSVSLPAFGSIVINGDNTITYSSRDGYVGSDSFVYSVTDKKSKPVESIVNLDVTEADPQKFPNGYLFRRRIVIDNNRLPTTSTLSDFPFYFEAQGDWLKSTDRGGNVSHSMGFDLRFELPDGSQLDHEIDSYDSVSGLLSAWTRLPALSSNSSTKFFLYYGKPGLTSSEEWSVGVWKNYLAVLDCETGSDRSGKGRDMISQDVTTATLLGTAGQFDGTSSEIHTTNRNWLDDLNAISVQAVFKANNANDNKAVVWLGANDDKANLGIGLYFDATLDKSICGAVKTDEGISTAQSIANQATTDKYWAALTWSSGNSVKLFGQGALMQLANTPSSLGAMTAMPQADTNGTVPLKIGSGNGHWFGVIDEVRFCAQELNREWLDTEYQNQRDPRSFYGMGVEETIDITTTPVAVPEIASTINTEAVDINVLANDTGSNLTISAISDPLYGTVQDLGSGLGPIRYTPNSEFVGEDFFEYSVSDIEGRIVNARVRVNVESGVVLLPPPPPNPLLSPDGSVLNPPVTFRWSPTESATDYLLRIRHRDTQEIAYATKRAAIRYNCESGTCSFDVGELGAGDYDWTVRPSIGDNNLDFADPIDFGLVQGPPSPPPPPPPADDLLPSPIRTIQVSNETQFDAAIDDARAGDHIILNDGTYGGARRAINLVATEQDPIVIKANSIGGATVQKGFDFRANSRNVYLFGLRIDPGESVVRGEGHKILRCYFKTIFEPGQNTITLKLREGKNINISYCDFDTHTTSFSSEFAGNTVHYFLGDHRTTSDKITNVTFDHCYFHDLPRGVNYQTPYLKVGNTGITATHQIIKTRTDVNWKLKGCLIHRCNTGDVLVESKTGGMTFEACTILDSDGRFKFRQGGGCIMRGCWFENTDGFNMYREDNIIHDNYMTGGGQFYIMAGKTSHTEFSNAQPRCYNATVVRNEGPLYVGRRFSPASQWTYPALNTKIQGHNGNINYDLHEGTSLAANVTIDLPEINPIKLKPSDVGPLADLS